VPVDLSPDDGEFRDQIRRWLAENLTGRFAGLRGTGGPGREHESFGERLAWNRHLAAAGLTCLGWPVADGGRGLSLTQQMIFHEEYARADAPARVSHVGEELLGPTVIAFGTQPQCRRFLPKIVTVTELWCQGFSEPGAGSDLASVATTARCDGGQWVISGQKTWTSLAHVADWCFLLARTERGSVRGTGLSMLLVPMRQERVTVRPITQLTGTSEFNEVFFDGARTDASAVLGEAGDGWRVARYLLGVERGVATFGQQIGFRRELDRLIDLASQTGAAADPLLRDKIARAWVGLEAIRAYALDTVARPQAPGATALAGQGTAGQGPAGQGTAGQGTAGQGAEASVLKLLWSRWHRALGELAMEVRGAGSMVAAGQPYELDSWQRLYLFSRADTIYGGSDEIQRGIIADRALGLPRQARS
jgi:alkylation response protein AidB-like acyl-CoA dehydrogenase